MRSGGGGGESGSGPPLEGREGGRRLLIAFVRARGEKRNLTGGCDVDCGDREDGQCCRVLFGSTTNNPAIPQYEYDAILLLL